MAYCVQCDDEIYGTEIERCEECGSVMCDLCLDDCDGLCDFCN